MSNSTDIRGYAERKQTALRSKGNRGFNKVNEITERVWMSRWYFPVLLILSGAFLLLDQQVLGVAVMVIITACFLALCPDVMAALCPFLILFLFAGPEYDDLSVFLPCAPLAAVLLAAVIVHMIRWPRPLRVGRSGFGLLLVALATALGGVGTISKADYFRAMSIYYIFGLGAGLLIFYVLFRSCLSQERNYDLQDRFMALLYTLGGMAILLVLAHYVHHFAEFVASHGVLDFKCRNFCATILLTTLPAPFYFARKNRWHLAVCALFAMVLVLTGSRSAILFGAILIVLCCVYLVRYRVVSWRLMVILGACAMLAVAIFGADHLSGFYGSRLSGGGFWKSGNTTRLKLWRCGIQDFRQHPLFGIGLGSSANAGLFVDASGGMTFYHNVVIQIMGSLGALGIIAYGWLVSTRIALLCRKRTAFTWAIALGYLGMLMVSMTNPGIICPLPNAALMMVAFAVIEAATDDTALPITKLRPLQRKSTVAK